MARPRRPDAAPVKPRAAGAKPRGRATSRKRTGPDTGRGAEVLARIAKAPGKFDFFTALRRLEIAFRNRPRIGEADRPVDEPVRLGQAPTMSFPTTPMAKVSPSTAAAPERILVWFFGLFGPNGPLPLHLTEYVRARGHNHSDHTFARFADIFHHRLLTQFYRAYANSQPTFSYDRPEDDKFKDYVGAVVGAGMPAFRDRDDMPDELRLYYAGRFSAQPKNAEGLEALVADIFGVETQIEQFVGQWMDIPIESRWRLGGAALGRGTTAGKRAWMCQGKFRIVLGPLKQKDFERLLPGGEHFSRLCSVVRSYVGDQFSWDVEMIIDKKSRQPWCLGKKTSQLGWTTALGMSQSKHGRLHVTPPRT